jgi:hypothetical protein
MNMRTGNVAFKEGIFDVMLQPETVPPVERIRAPEAPSPGSGLCTSAAGFACFGKLAGAMKMLRLLLRIDMP